MTDYQFDDSFAAPSDYAAMYRHYGLQVVPAHGPRPGNPNFPWKRPALSHWSEYQEALTPDDSFARWYGRSGEYVNNRQMGILTGRCSGNVGVIDLDTHKHPEAAAWWQGLLLTYNSGMDLETAEQRTGGGGSQKFFRFPDGYTIPTNRTDIGVDIRGQGGFAMLPPSKHESGNAYDWLPGLNPSETSIADAPDWLVDAVDSLVEQHGGVRGGVAGHVDRKASAGDFDDFGRRVDGREQAMRGLIMGALITFCGENGCEPTHEELHNETWPTFERENDATGKRDELAFSFKVASTLRRFKAGAIKGCANIDEAIAAYEARAVRKQERQPAPEIPSPSIRLFDFARLVTEDVKEEPDYIEPGALGYGGFMLIGGPPKAQKSFFLQDMLVTAACGGTMLGFFKVDRPLRVFWLQAELNEKMLRRRAKKMVNLTPSQIESLSSNLIVSDRFKMVLNEDGVRATVDLIKGAFTEAPDIIAFDPMANIFDQENENDNAQVMKFLTQRLEAVRQAINPMAGVILVHHATKKGPDEIRRDPFNCFRGGGSLRGYYDTGIIVFKKSEEGQEREVHFEFRAGETPDPMTVQLSEGRFIKVAEEAQKPAVSALDLDFIVQEVERRWAVGEPFAIGAMSPHLTLETYLIQHFGMPRKIAKSTIEKLVGMEAIKGDLSDKHSKRKGYRKHKWS